MRRGGSQDADATPCQICEALDIGVLRASDQLLSEGEIGPAHGHLGQVFRRALQGGDDDVVIASLSEAGDQIGPVVLDELGGVSQSLAQGLGQLDFESDELVGVVWRVKDIRRAAFGIVGPAQHLADLRFRGWSRAGVSADAGGPPDEYEE